MCLSSTVVATESTLLDFRARSVLDRVYLVVRSLPIFYCLQVCAGAHGGLLVSLVQRAAALRFQSTTDKSAHPDVLELKIHFFRPMTGGDLTIRLDDVVVGKQTSTIEARMSQGGKLCLMGLVRYATDRFNPSLLDAQITFVTGP